MRTRAGAAIAAVIVMLAAVLAGTASASAASASPGPIVRVQQGLLRGTVTNGVDRFAGIPYAAPPTGDLRWLPPQPPSSWTGVRDASAFGSECPQAGGGNEDCLYLNVYTPVQHGGGLPVMVYIHGGSYVSGAGSDYDPTPMVARGNAIVVTINYRLGLLGALALPQLDAQSGGLGSGTYSLQDQQAALRWVQKNIAQFGGDRGNVTIFGESAGATYVCQNVVSLAAVGLFRTAIAESGCGLPSTPVAQAEQFGEAIAAQLGCIGTGGAPDLSCLRAQSPDAINAAAAVVGGSVSAADLASVPVTGGAVLPRSVGDEFRAGAFNHVPLILGSNLNEGRLFIYSQAYGPIPTNQASYLASLQADLTPLTGVPAATIAAEYPVSNYPSYAEALSASVGDASFACRTLDADELAAGQVPVFGYEFSDPNAPSLLPIPGVNLGATHGSELPYLFSFPQTAELTAGQQAPSRTMISYWTGFARTHQPNSLGEPLWLPYVASYPLLQNLAPGAVKRFSTSAFSADHHCGFWGQML